MTDKSELGRMAEHFENLDCGPRAPWGWWIRPALLGALLGAVILWIAAPIILGAIHG